MAEEEDDADILAIGKKLRKVADEDERLRKEQELRLIRMISVLRLGELQGIEIELKEGADSLIFGGRGIICPAHTKRGEPRAIKLLDLADGDPEDYRAALREIDAMKAGNGHPHLITWYREGLVDNVVYAILEWLDGETVANILKRRPLSVEEGGKILLPICDALQHLHQRGIIHRDVKPENIMVTPSNRPVLFDLGLAFVPTETTVYPNLEHHFCGTLQYMSPEQANRAAAAYTMDVFSLGATLHQMLYRRSRYQRAGDYARFGGDKDLHLVEILRRVKNGELEPLPTTPDVPLAVQAVILKATSPLPSDRYQTATEFADALRQALVPAP